MGGAKSLSRQEFFCRDKGWEIFGRNLGVCVATEAGWLGGVATSARLLCCNKAPSRRSARATRCSVCALCTRPGLRQSAVLCIV